MRFSLFSVRIWILAVFLLWIFPINAQRNAWKSTEAEADEYFRVEEFDLALPLYLKLDSLQPDNGHLSTRLGICYLSTEFKYKALPYLEKGKRLGYTKDHIDFYLGRAYHLNHQFDEAIAAYTASLKPLRPGKARDLERMKWTDRLIEMCRSGKELVKNPVNVRIENLSHQVNSPYPEYAPVISADETVLIFTSRRPGTTGGMKDEHNQYFEDIYMSIKEDSQWTTPVNLGPPINTPGHDASIGLSPDGQELLIYKHDDGGDIYSSVLKADKWSPPVKVPGYVNSKSWEPSASISADEKILFFSSDREGGYGGRDIYVARKLPNEQWDHPKNLGPAINTPYDDDAPFIHADGTTLYFSSKGHNSMGGFDIFTARYDPRTDSVSNVANVGYPINTADDDIFFVWSADGTRAYFSSVRSQDNMGEKDIYVLHRPKTRVSLMVMKGRVFSKNTREPVAATLTVTDNTTNTIAGVYNSNSHTGKYTIIVPPGKNYGIAVESYRHVPFSENVFIPAKGEYFEMNRDILLEPLDEGSVTILKNVFFKPGSSELQKESFIELNKFYLFLKENPEVFAEIACHTDSIGGEEANLLLSRKQALTVKKYFTDKGIDSERICAVGYGEKFNIASNGTEEGRRRNRRTEIIILETVREGGQSSACEGYYNGLKEEKEVPGAKAELTEKNVTNLPPVYFDFNSFTINRFSRSGLDLWAEYLLANKAIRVEIGGHTDNLGSDGYNKALSNRRVTAVKEYLISAGVAAERIATRGYGESRPLAGNDTEEGRKKNRRVEITILR